VTSAEGLHLAFATFVGLPVVYAGTTKLLSPDSFVESLPRLQLRRLSPIPGAGRLVGGVELTFAGVALVAPSAWAAALLTFSYVVFTVVLTRALAAGGRGECGCFGELGGTLSHAAILRNVALGVLSVSLVLGRGLGSLLPYSAIDGAVVLALSALGSAIIDTIAAIKNQRA